jgi:hypothetical protein
VSIYDYESMCCAIDAAGPEYLAKFGITPKSWNDWRSCKKAAPTAAGGPQWETPSLLELHYPPHGSPRKTQQWDNWVEAMMMDMRLSLGNKAVLTRLALHYNVKTGDCFPAHGRVAAETAASNEMVRSTLRKAAKLGWIRRTFRAGGPREKSQTNLYELTLPDSICEVLAEINYHPPGPTPRDYKYPTPRGVQTGGSRGTNRGVEGYVHTPITGKYNREVIEQRKDTASLASLAQRAEDPSSKDLLEEGKRVGERALRGREQEAKPSPDPLEGWAGYTARELEAVRVGISTHGYDTVTAVVGFARENGYFLTPNIVSFMARDGHLIRDGDHIRLPKSYAAE